MSSSILPLYNQRGSPIPNRRSGFRLREKYLILIGAALLVCICYSGFVFLPDGEKSVKSSRISQKDGVGKGVKDFFKDPKRVVMPPADNGRPHDLVEDPHQAQDRERLNKRIGKAQIPAPRNQNDSLHAANVNPRETESVFGEQKERKEKIKQMMKLSWEGYEKYAWGANELRPQSKSGHSASIFGQSTIGATIVDSLDTLWIMGMKEGYEKARKWVEMSFNLQDVRGDLSVFETNIRFLGGFLSIYGLTKDDLFKQKAKEVADMLLPSFESPTGIPYALVNARTRSAKNWGWASGGSSILSEFGSLHLEFEYLSVITGDPVYAQKVKRIREVLNSLDKPGGLYPNYLNPKTGKWGSKHVSVGALGDSFYEYLLKSWVVTNQRDVEGKQMYDAAMKALEAQLLQRSKNGLVYYAEMKGSRLEHKMDHLACFVAGMYALQSANEEEEAAKAHALGLAKDIAHTCHESYIRTDTGIGPESFRFTPDVEAKAIAEREKYYILRPEVIEGWFYLWRVTKDIKYRDWAWDAAMAIEKYCKAEAGYAGIRNVYTTSVSQDDVQQSFFLAETLKYLYLIFADDSEMALDEWVFNTEAHAIPVRIADADHAPSSQTV